MGTFFFCVKMSRNENVLLTPSKLLSPMKRLMRQRRSSPYKVEKSTPRKDKRRLFAEESNLKNGIVESKVDDDNEFQQLEKNFITPNSTPRKSRRAKENRVETKKLFAEDSNLKKNVESKVDENNDFQLLDNKLEQSLITNYSTPTKSRRALVKEILKSKEKLAKENRVETSTKNTKQ